MNRLFYLMMSFLMVLSFSNVGSAQDMGADITLDDFNLTEFFFDITDAAGIDSWDILTGDDGFFDIPGFDYEIDLNFDHDTPEENMWEALVEVIEYFIPGFNYPNILDDIHIWDYFYDP